MKIPFLSKFFSARASPQNSLNTMMNNFINNFTSLFTPSNAGKAVTELTAMQTSAVYSCVRILSETIASLPLHTYTYTDKGKEKAYTHPLYYLLHDSPNPEMTSFIFREVLMNHLLLWGNAYIYIVRDGRGNVLELWPLLPDRMQVRRLNENGEIYYSYMTSSGMQNITNDQIMHIPALGFDGIMGYSPIHMAKEAIGLALATEEFGARFFANGASPGGVLEHPGVIKDPERLRKSWESVYQGSGNAHKICVLEEGVKYQSIGIPPNEAQFLETRKFQLNEICRIFRVAPHMVGDLERATFSNIENQSLEFVIYTIRPWIVRIEAAINKTLLSSVERGKYFVKINVDGLLRGDFKTRMEGYATGIQNGFLSPNDVRELENMNSIEFGDIYAMNGNMLKLQDVGAYIKYNNINRGGNNA